MSCALRATLNDVSPDEPLNSRDRKLFIDDASSTRTVGFTTRWRFCLELSISLHTDNNCEATIKMCVLTYYNIHLTKRCSSYLNKIFGKILVFIHVKTIHLWSLNGWFQNLDTWQDSIYQTHVFVNVTFCYFKQPISLTWSHPCLVCFKEVRLDILIKEIAVLHV